MFDCLIVQSSTFKRLNVETPKLALQ